MYLLKYNRSHDENIIRLQKDLTLLINNILPNDDLIKLSDECNEIYYDVQNYVHEYFKNYIKKSINYYNKIKNVLDNLENFNSHIEKYCLVYEITFEVNFDSPIKLSHLLNNNIFVPEIIFYSINLFNEPNFIFDKTLISNNIKKCDYDVLSTIFDCNHLFEIYEYPYFVISIKKTDEYIQHSSFYKEKKLFLKNSVSDEIIYLNFDTNLIYFNYLLNINSANINSTNIDNSDEIADSADIPESDDITNSDEVVDSLDISYSAESDYDKKPYKFFISKNNIIVYDGPLYVVKKHVDNNIIILDGIEYQIVCGETTFNIELLYNLMCLT